MEKSTLCFENIIGASMELFRRQSQTISAYRIIKDCIAIGRAALAGHEKHRSRWAFRKLKPDTFNYFSLIHKF